MPTSRATAQHDGRGTVRSSDKPAGASPPVPTGGLERLQRAAGNRAVATLLQRQADEAAGDQVRSVLGGGGVPLEAGFRNRAEQFFGANLSQVRVHTGGAAAESARAVGARAYTSGSNIVFGSGQYDTSSSAGQQRLAHELTHVVQQQRGPVAGTLTAGGLKISDPSDRFESEADRLGAAFLAGQPALVPATVASDSVQRATEDEGEELQMQPLRQCVAQRQDVFGDTQRTWSGGFSPQAAGVGHMRHRAADATTHVAGPARAEILRGLGELQNLLGSRAAVGQLPDRLPATRLPLPVQRNGNIDSPETWLSQEDPQQTYNTNRQAACALLQRYLSEVVQPACSKVIRADSTYSYLNVTYKEAKSELEYATTWPTVKKFVRRTLERLVENINEAINQVDERETEQARSAALQGDGGFPVGHTEGSQAAKAVVIRNDVLPDRRAGHRYVVWLEHHQNKHQLSMISEIGSWRGQTGTKFGASEGLQWHTDNTAVWARDWVRENEARIPQGGDTFNPNKTETVDDDITYDLKASLDGEIRHIYYHCNPKKDRK